VTSWPPLYATALDQAATPAQLPLTGVLVGLDVVVVLVVVDVVFVVDVVEEVGGGGGGGGGAALPVSAFFAATS